MPRFEVTVTQRDLAPVDAAAATKCKCKCDLQGPPSPARGSDRVAEDRADREARQSVQLSPLAEDPRL